MIDIFKTKGKDIAALILRVGFGFFIAFGHGLGKLMMLIGDGDIMFVSFFGLSPEINLILATFAEFICGIAIVLGFKTRIASFFLILTMLVAIIGVHLNDPLFQAYAQGGSSMESAFVYLIGFVSIFFLDAGKYSIESIINKE